MTAYYNEHDPYAAQWLRNLIDAGHIANGEVDERSIEDVKPSDLKGYAQCHFFAGIGGWSHALRRAGWADNRPVWTGSCPCQPFSTAGKGSGFADERHLWPAWQHLIQQCRPAVVFGEQVASKDGYAWLDLVHTDMEGMGYAFGSVVLPAAGFGAPHQRHRIYFVADAECDAKQQRWAADKPGQSDGASGAWPHAESGRCGDVGGVADNNGTGLEGRRKPGCECSAERSAGAGGVARGVEHTSSIGRERREAPAPRHDDDWEASGREKGEHGTDFSSTPRIHRHSTGPTNGYWRNADWLLCRDERWRPVESGTFPLAHGIPARMGKLRAYGNAIVPQVAAAMIDAYLSL